MTGPRPCAPTEAVQRALSMVGRTDGEYVLRSAGGGDYRPRFIDGKEVDLPWTTVDGHVGADCCGFAISWCYKLPRHRPGFNRGAWATIDDDINCNSAIEDGEHDQELFATIVAPEVGALLAYPTIYLPNHPPFVGHVCIVVSISRVKSWAPANPDYSQLDVAQCCGPNSRTPAVIATDGSIWNQHDHLWPKPQHRSKLLRALP